MGAAVGYPCGVLRYTLAIAGAWVAGAAALRATFMAPEVCPPITADSARAAASAAAGWIVANQHADGTYVYEYNRETGGVSTDYNVVRHAGVTMSLYQLAASGDHSALAAADRGLAYMRENLYRVDGWAAFNEPGRNPSLGASALLLAGLAQRREATGDASYDELMREIGRFVLTLQQPDGGFLARWDIPAGAPAPERSKYYTGEAFWALTLMRDQFPDEEWESAAWAAADYLVIRDEFEGYDFPPWADQWAAYGFAEMIDWDGIEEPHLTYASALAERFGFLVRVEARRTDSALSEWLHGRQARAAGLGTWVEGLSSLWVVSADPRVADLRPAITERLMCSAGMLVERQQSAADVGDRPGALVEGAWFTEGATRMDDQQHALSGLLYTAEILAGTGAE